MVEISDILSSINADKVTDKYPIKGLLKKIRLESRLFNLENPPAITEHAIDYYDEPSNKRSINVFEFDKRDNSYFNTGFIDLPKLPLKDILYDLTIKRINFKYGIIPVVYSDSNNLFRAEVIIPVRNKSQNTLDEIQNNMRHTSITLDSEKETIANKLNLILNNMGYTDRGNSLGIINYTMLPLSEVKGNVSIRHTNYSIAKSKDYNILQMYIMPDNWNESFSSLFPKGLLKTKWDILGNHGKQIYTNKEVIYGLE